MKNKIKIRSRVWLVNDEGEVVFGNGRAVILKAVDETGSMAQAAKKLGMSYRAVWGKVKATEERLDKKLVTKCVGRRKGKNTCLTPVARTLIQQFDELERLSEDHVDKAARDLFDFDLSELSEESGDSLEDSAGSTEAQ